MCIRDSYDEGIDFTDNPQNSRIIGQAKNFILTPIDKLMRKLEEEKERVSKLQPEAYYLFLPKNLTRKRLKKIVNLFNPVTRFDFEHIFTLGKMDELLQKKEYRDILEKHPKLWNFSMDILSREMCIRDSCRSKASQSLETAAPCRSPEAS